MRPSSSGCWGGERKSYSSGLTWPAARAPSEVGAGGKVAGLSDGSAGASEEETSSETARGTRTGLPQAGHFPFLPALSSFPFNRWPQREQLKEIINSPALGRI